MQHATCNHAARTIMTCDQHHSNVALYSIMIIILACILAFSDISIGYILSVIMRYLSSKAINKQSRYISYLPC